MCDHSYAIKVSLDHVKISHSTIKYKASLATPIDDLLDENRFLDLEIEFAMPGKKIT